MYPLHPVVIYYHTAENSISHFLHFVYKVIIVIMEDLKEKLPHLNSLHLFKDRCVGQYKN